MKKTIIKLASVLLTAAICLPSAGTSAVSFGPTMKMAAGNTDFAVKTAAIVKEDEFSVKKGKSTQSLGECLRIIGRAKNESYDFSGLGFETGIINTDNRFILTFSDSLKMKKALAKLESDGNILYVSRDEVIYTQELSVESGEYMSWGVDALGMGDYADYLAHSELDGSVTVAIVDSGVADVGIISDKLTCGYDFVSNDNDATNDTSSNSHGTFLGSIIADSTKVLPVDIMPVRVLSSSTGSLSNAVNGIIYAADNGADIINVSLGGVFSSCEILDDAVNYADSKGASVIVCAGNKKMDTSAYCPAHNECAVTVSSVGNGLEFSESFSNFGAEVDCCAPGESISGLTADGSETVMSGTSMSAAFVSAGAAMLKLANPSCNPAQIQQTIKDICNDLGKKGFDDFYGWGIPDFSRLVTEKTVYVKGIDLEISVINAEIGESLKNKVIFFPSDAENKGIKWYSDDNRIATVDFEGTIRAVSPGKCRVTAVAEDGGYEASCTVNVLPPVHTAAWVIGNKTVKQEFRTGERVVEPVLDIKQRENLTGWDIPLPDTMPDEDIIFRAVYDYNALKIINAPYDGVLTVDFRTTVVFHADGALNNIEWFVNGSPVTADPDGGCTVSGARNDYEIYCRGTDSEGRIFTSKVESVTVRKGFFDRLKAFFRKIFGKLPLVYQ